MIQLRTSSERPVCAFCVGGMTIGGEVIPIFDIGKELVELVRRFAQQDSGHPIALVARGIAFGEMRSVKKDGQSLDELVIGRRHEVPADSAEVNYSRPEIQFLHITLSVRDFCVLLSLYFTGSPMALNDPRYTFRRELQALFGN